MSASRSVEADLAALLRAEIVRELRRYPHFECTFKHALLREAALFTLTPSRRRALYARAAEVVETMFADSLDDYFACRTTTLRPITRSGHSSTSGARSGTRRISTPRAAPARLRRRADSRAETSGRRRP
jgi:hypothetical protein